MVEILGNRLRNLRMSKQLKQEQVAALMEVTRSSICAYENDSRQPSLDIIVRFAILYRVSTDYLLGCAHDNTIDASGLSQMELVLLTNLVADMTNKNKKIEKLEAYRER